MLIEVDYNEFKNRFTKQLPPFLSLDFLELNKKKVDRLIYLIEDKRKGIDIGIVLGLREQNLLSPFSAPYGGFHYRHSQVKTDSIDAFLEGLKQYVLDQNIKDLKIALPPDFYDHSFNAKAINSLHRAGFEMQLPEITNWVDLKTFDNHFNDGNSRNNYNKAVKYNLRFQFIENLEAQKEAYQLVCENRNNLGRPIYMSFENIKEMESIWPVDFFAVYNEENDLVASAIFYRAHPEYIYGTFWGDNLLGRPLRAMDFLSFNLWAYYKAKGFRGIDLGISTESGIPNQGLLRFKESHESISSLRLTFEYSNQVYHFKE